jgi:cell wall-associated NlpC family hydrolase
LVLGGGAFIVLRGGGSDASGVATSAKSSSGEEVNLNPALLARARKSVKSAGSTSDGSHPQVVVPLTPGEAPALPEKQPSSKGGARAQTDAQIRADLATFRSYLSTIPPTTGKRAEVISSGEAAAPFNAPPIVIQIVQAANEIARTPYRWGGGHSAWRDKGYDCSGSVSFALAAVGLLNSPLDSTAFEKYGAAGPGRWVTIYANATHAWMTVAGLRFDTGGLSRGTRWQSAPRSTAGFVARHPPGL